MSQPDNDVFVPPTTAVHLRTPAARQPTRMSSAVTIRDVARESGVSIGTVSNVLNGRVALVRAETRDRVLHAARTLNFQPSAAARSLVQGRTRTLGVLFHTSTGAVIVDPYASAVLQGILGGAADAGYGVLLYPEPWKSPEQGARLFADRRADGVLAIAPRVEMIPDLAALGLPLALVSVRFDSGEAGETATSDDGIVFTATDVDNAEGGRLATEHLLLLGHRKIAHLFGDEFQRSAHDRETGWRAALAAAGIVPPDEYRVVCDYQGDTGYAATHALLALPDPPTAIFAANDRLAFACMRAARDAGVAMPEQLSVVGFDDIPAAPLVMPPLTTVRQPLAQIGRVAVERLIARLENRSGEPLASADDYRLFSPELVIRGSTAAPAGPPTASASVPSVSVPAIEGVQK